MSIAAVVPPTPAPTAAMAARAAGFALTWPTFTTPIRGTDLAGSGRPGTWRTAGWRPAVEAAQTASDMMRFT